MVASSYSAASGSADSALDPDLVNEIAALRARATSWEDTAAKVRWDVNELQRVLRRDRAWPAALDAARRAFEREVATEALCVLRAQMTSDKPQVAKAAAKIVLDYDARRCADETKLEIERARANARCAPRRGAEEDDADAEPERGPTAEEVARYEVEVKAAAERFAERAKVCLWSGCHRLDAEPDATDTELSLRPETTAAGRVIYWARFNRLIGRDPYNGPFLPPPGCKPNEVPVYTG
jgi:hypothetical protein